MTEETAKTKKRPRQLLDVVAARQKQKKKYLRKLETYSEQDREIWKLYKWFVANTCENGAWLAIQGLATRNQKPLREMLETMRDLDILDTQIRGLDIWLQKADEPQEQTTGRCEKCGKEHKTSK